MRPTCDRMSLYNLKKEGEKKATRWKAAVWDPGWKKHSGPLRVMGSCEEVTGYGSLTPGANKAASSYPALCKSPRTRRYRLHLYTECGTACCLFHFLLFSLRQKCESVQFREIAIFSLFFFPPGGKKSTKVDTGRSETQGDPLQIPPSYTWAPLCKSLSHNPLGWYGPSPVAVLVVGSGFPVWPQYLCRQ